MRTSNGSITWINTYYDTSAIVIVDCTLEKIIRQGNTPKKMAIPHEMDKVIVNKNITMSKG